MNINIFSYFCFKKQKLTPACLSKRRGEKTFIGRISGDHLQSEGELNNQNSESKGAGASPGPQQEINN